MLPRSPWQRLGAIIPILAVVMMIASSAANAEAYNAKTTPPPDWVWTAHATPALSAHVAQTAMVDKKVGAFAKNATDAADVVVEKQFGIGIASAGSTKIKTSDQTASGVDMWAYTDPTIIATSTDAARPAVNVSQNLARSTEQISVAMKTDNWPSNAVTSAGATNTAANDDATSAANASRSQAEAPKQAVAIASVAAHQAFKADEALPE